jgi:hypothetical protein
MAIRLYHPLLTPDFAPSAAAALGTGLAPADIVGRISALHGLVPTPAPTACGFGGDCFRTCMAYQGLGSQSACTFLCGRQPAPVGPVVTRPLLPPHQRTARPPSTVDVGSCLRQCTDARDPAGQARCAAGCAALTGAPASAVDASAGCVKFCLPGCPQGPGYAQCAKDCVASCSGQVEEMPISQRAPNLFR